MKRKTKFEILLGNIDKASADLKKTIEESQKRMDESFAKYEHKVEVAHHNSMIINEKQIEEIPCNPS
jgi:predicted nucleic acid-binding OB-fold protein